MKEDFMGIIKTLSSSRVISLSIGYVCTGCFGSLKEVDRLGGVTDEVFVERSRLWVFCRAEAL
eukprot:scaffold17707_cov212-Amphora_coffeaeformis.AAC.6